ncbi:MAG: hypothetical protein SCH66_03885 [Methanolobus sp.]|nr:hypothetical protein [Methanolobus sp.]
MSFKSFLLKKMILWYKIPTYVKWKKSVSGIGIIYTETLEMMQEKYGSEGVENLNDVMYNIGLRQATEILEMLDLQKNLEGCAYVLLTMHRMFGIRSKIVHNDNNRIVIHATKCQWGGHIPKWNAGTCISIDHYEAGLIEGILPHSKHEYTKRRSCGNNICELVIKL